MNPLLTETGALPDFAAVRPEHVTPALDELLARAEAGLEQAVSDQTPADYDALSRVLDVPVERLSSAWRAVNHLQSVVDTPALRAAHAENLPRVTAFFTKLGADERLYAKYKALAASPAAATLTPARRRALELALRDFVLGGAELQGADRERFAAIQARLAELSQQFGEHVLDATDGWSLFVDASALAGVPEDVVAAARKEAQDDGRDGCKLTLHHPRMRPVLQFATDRELRRTVYTAHAQRASEFGPPALDNTPLMREIVALRQELARLLGHDSYADLSMVPKMAEHPRQVTDFVRDLARRARPYAESDLAELRRFADTELGLPDLQAWDLAFASEQMRQRRFAFSSSEVKAYFTLPRTIAGLFQLVERLFEVTIRPAPAPLWHPQVLYHEVLRDGQPIAGFTTDLHARPGKQGGAWMDDARSRWRRPDDGSLQLPVAHLVCNFASPVGDRPALLTHDDVITLFHEFGHGLHHMLTQVDDLPVAGIAGVEWDAVELPSQFMENYAWEYDVLVSLSAHVDTGRPLPRELFDRMLQARNFHSGLQMLRHCEFGLFDMRLHAEDARGDQVQRLAEEVRAEVAVAPAPPWLRYPHGFTHIFDGGYAAGYYSYQWAEVLSADAYAAFEEAGPLDVETGRRYRRQILETGGSRAALENFTAFRGRGPTLDALLRHHGLA